MFHLDTLPQFGNVLQEINTDHWILSLLEQNREEFLLKELHKENPNNVTVLKQPDLPENRMLRELFSLTGRDALNRILEQRNPHHDIQRMAPVDFFWLIKKIGEEDALPILKLASPEQWQYLLDMELWQGDRIDLDRISLWLERFHRADPQALVAWLINHGQALAYFYLFRNIQVEAGQWDEDGDVPEGFFSLDGVYFIRIRNKEHEELIGNILREMAHNNYEQYQSFILGLAGLLPSEVEEGMYRMRNVRLAEGGFLPLEEALSVYTYMRADALLKAPSISERLLSEDVATDALVPVTPLNHTQDNKFLTGAVSRLRDPLLLDRIRLEFAGLCNQILSADGLVVNDFEALIRTCRKAAGYLSLGLERLTDGNFTLAEQLLRQHPLLSVFRVGFGLALELKWEVERWIREAWFHDVGLKPDFWGDEWGPTLSGLLKKRPRFFGGDKSAEDYRDFEQLSDLDHCRQSLRHVIALDRILKATTAIHPLDATIIQDPFLTFHPLLFTFWARRQLKLDAGFAPLSTEQMRRFFEKIRGRTGRPPHRMTRFKDVFLRDMISVIPDHDPVEEDRFKETLSYLWTLFVDEYAWVPEEGLNEKFTRFLLLASLGDKVLH